MQKTFKLGDTAQLPTKPDQGMLHKLEDWMKGTPKSSNPPKPRRKQNKEVKNSLLS